MISGGVWVWYVEFVVVVVGFEFDVVQDGNYFFYINCVDVVRVVVNRVDGIYVVCV